MSPEPGPINFGGVGDIDMFPAETQAAIRRIAQAGNVVADTWAEVAPRIAADEAKVGTGFDDMSAAFREVYNLLKPQLVKLAEKVPENFEQMARTGNDIVDRYLRLTQQQVDRMRSVE